MVLKSGLKRHKMTFDSTSVPSVMIVMGTKKCITVLVRVPIHRVTVPGTGNGLPVVHIESLF